jgi:hydrogenase-4 component F
MELIFIIAILTITAFLNILIKKRVIIEFLSIVSSAVSLVLSVVVAVKVSVLGIYSPFLFFSVDSFGAIVMVIVAFVGFTASAYSIPYLRQETAKDIIGFTRVKQYFVLSNLFLTAMFLAVMASNPIFAWIAIEVTTLSTAFLVSFYNKPSMVEAAWKYLIINSVGLLLGFMGTLLYFTSVNSLGGDTFVSWQILLENASHLDALIAKIAFVFVLVGYGTKVGLAPMHTWKPDAYSKVPAPIGALLSGALLPVAFLVILRFKAITDISIGSSFSGNLLIVFGLLSVAVAALIILNSKNYKRLLAYSSIENAGVVALGFGFGGVGIFTAVLHIIYNALIKSALFLSAGNIFLKYSSTKIEKVKGVLTALPATGVIFLAGFLAITGMPPFGIFVTKIFILSAGILAHPVATIMALIFMTILFTGFLRQVVAMIFGEKPAGVETGESNVWLVLPPLLLMAVALGLSVYIPSLLQTLINNVVLHY